MSLLASRMLPLGAKGRLYSAWVHRIILVASETWSTKEEDVIRLERNNARMVRYMCNIRPEDRIFAEELRTRLKLKSMRKYLQDRKLHCFGHLERMEANASSSKCRTFKVSGSFPIGQPRNTWNEVSRSDLKERKGKSART